MGIDPESREKRTLLTMPFITQAIPDIWENLEKLEAECQTPLSTLVEGAFKVLNLMAVDNKERGLIKKMQFLSADSPTTSRGPWRDEKVRETTKKLTEPERVYLFCQKRGNGRANVLSTHDGTAKGEPRMAPVRCTPLG